MSRVALSVLSVFSVLSVARETRLSVAKGGGN